MTRLGQEGETTNQLNLLQQQLQESLDKTLTKADVVILQQIDEDVLHFIKYVRSTMTWFDKKLNVREIEILFGMMD